SASSISAASRTVRASGPSDTSSSSAPDGAYGTRPCDGLSPTTPQNAAGMRIEPAPSPPCASGPIPVATAAAAPPLQPPAVRSRENGLRVGPVGGLPESPFQPSSGRLVLPSRTAPAERRRSTSGASASGTQSANRREPIVVRMPAVGTTSFTETGTPHSNGGREPPAA